MVSVFVENALKESENVRGDENIDSTPDNRDENHAKNRVIASSDKGEINLISEVDSAKKIISAKAVSTMDFEAIGNSVSKDEKLTKNGLIVDALVSCLRSGDTPFFLLQFVSVYLIVTYFSFIPEFPCFNPVE